MASFGVHQEGLDDLPQQRGTRESLLPCVVQSRACAHNITGRGGQKFVPGTTQTQTCKITHDAFMAHAQFCWPEWRQLEAGRSRQAQLQLQESRSPSVHLLGLVCVV